MYKFWYDYVKRKIMLHGYMDTDKLTVYIKTEDMDTERKGKDYINER